MKTRKLFPLLMSMALPNILSMLINSLYNIVDSFFVARISEKAMSAISIVFPIQNLSLSVAVGMGIGVNAAIALLMGRGDRKKAGFAGTLGMILFLVHGLLALVLCTGILPGFLKLYTEDPEVLSMGVKYGTLVFLFAPVQHLYIGTEKIYQSLGRMKTTMVCMSFGCIVNIILDPILIFGLGPVPPMGIAGAAWATGIGMTLELMLYGILYRLQPISISLFRISGKPEGDILKKIYGVGIPASLNMALPSLLISALNSILMGFSSMYIVILGAYYKLQTFVYMPVNGLIQGLRPLVGYNFGAGAYGRVRKLYGLALGVTTVMMAAGTCVCFLMPETLMGMFADHPETIAQGAKALKIIALGFLASGISCTGCGCMEGLGMGIAPLSISLLRYTVPIIPAAWLFGRLAGPMGVFHAFWVTELITACAALLIFRRSLKARIEEVSEMGTA